MNDCVCICLNGRKRKKPRLNLKNSIWSQLEIYKFSEFKKLWPVVWSCGHLCRTDMCHADDRGHNGVLQNFDG